MFHSLGWLMIYFWLVDRTLWLTIFFLVDGIHWKLELRTRVSLKRSSIVRQKERVGTLYGIIHRMEIRQTTRSAPGTSSMKVRLVRPWCFVLTMLPLKKSCFVDGLVCFISLCLQDFEFLNATWREWNLPQVRKRFFFQFPRSPLRGRQTK